MGGGADGEGSGLSVPHDSFSFTMRPINVAWKDLTLFFQISKTRLRYYFFILKLMRTPARVTTDSNTNGPYVDISNRSSNDVDVVAL